MPDILVGPVDGCTAVHTFMEKELYVGKVHGRTGRISIYPVNLRVKYLQCAMFLKYFYKKMSCKRQKRVDNWYVIAKGGNCGIYYKFLFYICCTVDIHNVELSGKYPLN